MKARRREHETVTQHLLSSLEQLEEAAGVPPLAGEIAQWCESISDQIADVNDSFRAALRAHADVLETILDVDLELAAQVKQLRIAEEELRKELVELRQEVRRALELAASGHPAEGTEPAQKVDALRDDVLSWIVRCRAYEQELRTWFIEAFNRDRGEQD